MKPKHYLFVLLGIFVVVTGVVLSGALSIVSSGGNTYTEYRCIDVSQYYDEGYTLDHIDEYGCEVVMKKEFQGATYNVEFARPCPQDAQGPEGRDKIGHGRLPAHSRSESA